MANGAVYHGEMFYGIQKAKKGTRARNIGTAIIDHG